MAVRLGLFGLLATCVSGAYLQWQPCDNVPAEKDLAGLTGLRATLQPLDNGRDNRLVLEATRWLEAAECEELVRMMPAAALEVEMLGRSSVFTNSTEATCKKLPSKYKANALKDPAALKVAVSNDIGFLPPLSTFHATLHLQDNDSAEASCRQANITPALSSTTTSAINYITAGIFLFVLLVGAIRSAYSTPISLDEEDQRTIRAVLPNVGDCLQYIQFIFLTGGLSLRYPGFYQPVVSNLNWFSLFVNGPVTHGRTYDRVGDGIYVMNGTYGGTYGLELMTQIAGAPMTMDTWVNMVVLMGIITFGFALIIEVFWFINRNRDSDSEFPRSAGGMRHTSSRVLRIILSYFMLPLASLSFYQLVHATRLPAYHTSMAVALIVAMMAAFVWLLRQIPTRSLGVLVFDSTKRYQRVAPSENFRRQDETFILILFVLLFVRGAAIGGLQISGPSQLAVLGACELVLLASIAGFQAYSTFSVGAIAATMRLCSLVFMVSFLPGLATHDIKSAIGYVLLALHGGMLVLGFLTPAACELWKLLTSWWKAPRPHVYGLRQLRRREVSRTNLSAMYASETSYVPYPDADAVEEPAAGYLHPTYRADSPSTLRLDSSTTSSRYFRPPRSPSRATSVSSFDHHGRADSIASPVSSAYPPSRTTSTSTSFTEKRSVGRSVSVMSPPRLSESTEEEEEPPSPPLPPSPTGINGRPLGPKWSDYSFREADLYYGAPRPRPAERASEDLPRPPAPKPSVRSSSGIWARFTGQSTAEQGFQVIRPEPEQGFVVVRPNRPSNPSNGSP
ncbi:integral membrane protein [Colletotrichum musicola]|uniref:Integral membrane protein n=1 Tax=Colletotrichum musicola TaxID=2175873 RepID=A0A8H6NH96_9PEZI|nr:integral membrane protein [Colletotrichum musicola]